MEQADTRDIRQEVESLKRIVLAMKEEMEDRFLSAEEEVILEESRKDLEQGNCISLEDFENELDRN